MPAIRKRRLGGTVTERRGRTRSYRPRHALDYWKVVVAADTGGNPSRGLLLVIAVDVNYASAALRDRFLHAIDAQDRALCDLLAQDLKNCMNPLPGMTCEQLGLSIGSTYGVAARHVLEGMRCRPAGVKDVDV